MCFYSKAARLQAPSHAVARAIVAEAPRLADKVSVVPNPVPIPAMSPPALSDRDRIVLFVGRVHPEKGVHVLVDAFASGARAAFADWRLMIVGPTETTLGGGGEAYLASLQHAAENAKGKVTFSGAIFDSAKLANTYRSARLFVYPSLAERGESFGLAPLEAMAHGCAVLVSNLDCFQDFVRDNETGFIFDHRAPSNSETLRARIENVIGNDALLARVAAAGHQKSAEYSPEQIADQFLSDFERAQGQSA
jgi:glycosyltransferase involved in cell wall biosynthesis